MAKCIVDFVSVLETDFSEFAGMDLQILSKIMAGITPTTSIFVIFLRRYEHCPTPETKDDAMWNRGLYGTWRWLVHPVPVTVTKLGF